MSLAQFVDLNCHGDARGSLVSLETQRNVPFSIKRVYYLFGTTKGVSRGHHAHKALRQMMIPLAGHCEIHLDNGTQKEMVTLDNPKKGLLIDSMIWREMHHFSADCVLLVLASSYYDEQDYIRSYETFLNEANRD